MEASNVTSSFLCFLPELQCTPTNALYVNGITESNGNQHFSTKPIPLSHTKKKCSNGTLDSPNRYLSASAEAGSGLSNGFVHDRVSTAGNICQREVLDIGSFAASMEGSRAELEHLDLETRTLAQSSEKGESGCIPDAECNGNHNLVQGCFEEEDDLAFEITKFFNSFQDGQEHNVMEFKAKPDVVSPESSLEPKSCQLGPISKITPKDTSSAGRSGKWNGYLEVDSFSATFSGPLTFSGPISYSGHSGQTPYSGSVSHRSDSSTASTHSFAFPILPCEWNSSPVKMAQPDQRFTKKPWKRRLLSFVCCTGSFD